MRLAPQCLMKKAIHVNIFIINQQHCFWERIYTGQDNREEIQCPPTILSALHAMTSPCHVRTALPTGVDNFEIVRRNVLGKGPPSEVHLVQSHPCPEEPAAIVTCHWQRGMPCSRGLAMQVDKNKWRHKTFAVWWFRSIVTEQGSPHTSFVGLEVHNCFWGIKHLYSKVLFCSLPSHGLFQQLHLSSFLTLNFQVCCVSFSFIGAAVVLSSLTHWIHPFFTALAVSMNVLLFARRSCVPLTLFLTGFEHVTDREEGKKKWIKPKSQAMSFLASQSSF